MPSNRDPAASKPALRVHADPAFNAEPDPHALDSPITPFAAFFVRNNGTVPDIRDDAAADWRLTIDGEVERPMSFTIDDLSSRFRTVDVTSVLECAGNSRFAFEPATDGVPWGHGAVACAQWSGVRMRDLLEAAGVKPSAVYVAHESPDCVVGEPGNPALSRGLPLAKAMADETLVAFAMNGAPLPMIHGYPIRVVAPGYPGSAWQKWLTRLWVRDREHDGARMTGTDYRMPRRSYAPGEKVDTAEFDVMTDMPVKSLVTFPAEGFAARVGAAIEVRGFAWSGHTALARVDVSIDGGTTWAPASLEPVGEPFAWRRFTATVAPRQPGAVEIMTRATDVSGCAQPLQPPWNPRGYCNNAVHRVRGLAMPA